MEKSGGRPGQLDLGPTLPARHGRGEADRPAVRLARSGGPGAEQMTENPMQTAYLRFCGQGDIIKQKGTLLSFPLQRKGKVFKIYKLKGKNDTHDIL